jgi:hypothetical protein
VTPAILQKFVSLVSFIHSIVSPGGKGKPGLNDTHGGMTARDVTPAAAILPNFVPDSKTGAPAQNWVKIKCPDRGVTKTVEVD